MAGDGTEGGEGQRSRKRRKGDGESAALLDDDRFKAMFEDAEFRVDEASEEYKQLHPNVVKVRVAESLVSRVSISKHFDVGVVHRQMSV